MGVVTEGRVRMAGKYTHSPIVIVAGRALKFEVIGLGVNLRGGDERIKEDEGEDTQEMARSSFISMPPSVVTSSFKVNLPAWDSGREKVNVHWVPQLLSVVPSMVIRTFST